MKALRQFGAVLLLLGSLAAPAMACAAPGAQMTAEERACCRVMMSQCGQMEMPASQDCCKSILSSDHGISLKTETVSFRPAMFVAILASPLDLFVQQGMGHSLLHRPEHSPPKAPPSAITVLRI